MSKSAKKKVWRKSVNFVKHKHGIKGVVERSEGMKVINEAYKQLMKEIDNFKTNNNNEQNHD